MHVDDLPEDIPQERLVWVTTTNRYLVDSEELAAAVSNKKNRPPFQQVLSDICFDIEMVSSRGGQPIGVCEQGHVITADEVAARECGWCEAAWEQQQEARYDR